MRRLLIFATLIFLVWGHPLLAANPDDIEFRARAIKDSHSYHMGEPIEIEISYSSQAEKTPIG